jgi:hypothetical protein
VVTDAVKAGHDGKQLQLGLAHTSDGTTDIYIKERSGACVGGHEASAAGLILEKIF